MSTVMIDKFRASSDNTVMLFRIFVIIFFAIFMGIHCFPSDQDNNHGTVLHNISQTTDLVNSKIAAPADWQDINLIRAKRDDDDEDGNKEDGDKKDDDNDGDDDKKDDDDDDKKDDDNKDDDKDDDDKDKDEDKADDKDDDKDDDKGGDKDDKDDDDKDDDKDDKNDKNDKDEDKDDDEKKDGADSNKDEDKKDEDEDENSKNSKEKSENDESGDHNEKGHHAHKKHDGHHGHKKHDDDDEKDDRDSGEDEGVNSKGSDTDLEQDEPRPDASKENFQPAEKRLRCQNSHGEYMPIATICKNRIPDKLCQLFLPIDKNRPHDRPERCDLRYMGFLVIMCAKHCKICCELAEYGCGDAPTTASKQIACIYKSTMCHELTPAMYRNCAASCGLCNKGPCRDKINGCITFRGRCHNRPDIQDKCARSCGVCTPTCKNDSLFCRIKTANGRKCHGDPYSDGYQKTCKRTCGLCAHQIALDKSFSEETSQEINSDVPTF